MFLRTLAFTLLFAIIAIACGWGWYATCWPGAGGRTQSAEGSVVEVVSRTSKAGEHFYAIIEFNSPGGELIRFESNEVGRKDFLAGQKVDVRYAPDDVEAARLDSLQTMTSFGPMLLLTFSVLSCLVVGWSVGQCRKYVMPLLQAEQRPHRSASHAVRAVEHVHQAQERAKPQLGTTIGAVFMIAIATVVLGFAVNNLVGVWHHFQVGRVDTAIIVSDGLHCRKNGGWEVIDQTKNFSGRGRACHYFAMAELTDPAGATRQFELEGGRYRSRYRLGQHLDVRYKLEGDPTPAVDDLNLYLPAPILIALVALLFGGSGFLIWRYGPREH